MNAVLEAIERELDAGFAMGPFHRHWLMERAPEKVRRNLELARRHPGLVGARQGFASADTNDGNTAAFTAVNTSTSELNILGATQALVNQYCAIPTNDARAGKMYRVNFTGLYGNTGTPTLIFTPRWGSSTTPATNVTFGASVTYQTITGTTALPIYGQFDVTIRTSPPGATAGTAWGQGFVILGIPITSLLTCHTLYMGGTQATIDTTGQGTAGCGITINATWSASSSSNTITVEQWSLRSLN